MIKLKELFDLQEQEPAGPVPLKTDIPESPFGPDAAQIAEQLRDILKRWKTARYESDKQRWKSYYRDITRLVKQIGGQTDEI